MNDSDIVALWSVALSDGIHEIKFEHGTTTGKRVVWVDGVEILRKNWMFKLVGKIDFTFENSKALISIEACTGFAYEYTLFIDGKPLQKHRENRKKITKVWTLSLNGVETRIVLEKEKMDVWVNGCVLETTAPYFRLSLASDVFIFVYKLEFRKQSRY